MRRVVVLACLVVAATSMAPRRIEAPALALPASLSDETFWRMISEFSEPSAAFTPSGGYRSDNLVSNERSDQDVVPQLLQVHGGAYLGVGPEQNLTYIAALQPSIAFIVDIRRDNLLLHLIYKALIEMSSSRADFLSRLFGRSPALTVTADTGVNDLFAAFRTDRTAGGCIADYSHAIVRTLREDHHFALTAGDQRRIGELYRTFCARGPDIRWADDAAWIPSYTELMTQRDPTGAQRSYLATEGAFARIKQYEETNRIVPLVGDFAGGRTIPSIGRYLRDRRATLSLFYTSNVEPYLKGSAWNQFVANVRTLPIDAGSRFVRTTFHQIGETDAGRPAYRTSTTTAPIAEALAEWGGAKD
jgi:hypothetical protein